MLTFELVSDVSKLQQKWGEDMDPASLPLME